MIELSLVLPVLNEENLIGQVVSDISLVLKKNKISFELILVENGSTDNTLGVLKSLAKKDKNVRVLVTKMGYGEAILGGLNKALGKFVGYMPSDGQVNTNVLPKLFAILKHKEADIVGIQRTTRESFIRKIRSKVFNFLAKNSFGLSAKDINGDPKIFPKTALKILKLESKDSFLSTELLIKAKKLKWRLKEVPTVSLLRTEGKSTVKFKTVLEFLRNIIRYKFCQISKTPTFSLIV